MSAGLATLLRNARLDAITTFAGNAALLRLYDGTRPATGGAATTKIAEFTLGSPLAAASAGGVLTITPPANTTGLPAAGAGDAATWARIVKSDGTTFVMDLSVSATGGGGDLQLNSTTISSGVTVSVTSFTVTDGNP